MKICVSKELPKNIAKYATGKIPLVSERIVERMDRKMIISAMKMGQEKLCQVVAQCAHYDRNVLCSNQTDYRFFYLDREQKWCEDAGGLHVASFALLALNKILGGTNPQNILDILRD